VLHQDGRRYQAVTLNPTTRDVVGFVAKAKQELAAKLELPQGVYIQFAGAAEGQVQAQRELLIHVLTAGLGIVLLLMIAFPNVRSLALILLSLPFALVGGVVAVGVTGATLSIGSWVGFVTLFGIAARNAILLVAHVEQLIAEEGQPWSFATVLRGTRERLVPILMTALVTALGLVPLALASGEAGREVQGPMAVVILGGLITSTVMNLLVLPVLMQRYWRPRP
jgi:Cu/Ag efflux pump CusA